MNKFIFIALLFTFPLCVCAQNEKPLTDAKGTDDTVYATKNCTIESSEMPLIRGVRLGMSYEEVKDIYPEIIEDKFFHKKFDETKSGLFMMDGEKIKNPEFRHELQQISLNFENNKIIIFAFVFDSGKWNGIYEAISELSVIFNVDSNYWTVFYQQSTKMKCADFDVYANHLKISKFNQNAMNIHKRQTKNEK